jgi:hypothetical protein
MAGLDRFLGLALSRSIDDAAHETELSDDEAEQAVELAQRILDEFDAPALELFERVVQRRLAQIDRKLALLMRTVATLGEFVVKQAEMPWPRRVK